jgi:hypothetical protein
MSSNDMDGEPRLRNDFSNYRRAESGASAPASVLRGKQGSRPHASAWSSAVLSDRTPIS